MLTDAELAAAICEAEDARDLAESMRLKAEMHARLSSRADANGTIGPEPAQQVGPHRLHDIGRVELRPQRGGQLTADNQPQIRLISPEHGGGGGIVAAPQPLQQFAQRRVGCVGHHIASVAIGDGRAGAVRACRRRRVTS